ncbi:MAG: hypothetical protein R2873_12065 [Caldilineaceae bacterium]
MLRNLPLRQQTRHEHHRRGEVHPDDGPLLCRADLSEPPHCIDPRIVDDKIIRTMRRQLREQ